MLEANPVGAAVRRFMQRRDEWSGTAQQLLDELTQTISEQSAKTREWPKQPNLLSGKLRRAALALRKIGINVLWSREGSHEGARLITIEKRTKPESKPETSSASSEPSAPSAEAGNINDLGGNGADDTLTMADDPEPPADDTADDQGRGIVSSNPLQKKPSDDADDADDQFALRSERPLDDDDTRHLTIRTARTDLEAAYNELRLRGDWPPKGDYPRGSITAGSSVH